MRATAAEAGMTPPRAWGRFYESVFGEIYGKKFKLVKLKIVITLFGFVTP
jgi:hypothetical protein